MNVRRWPIVTPCAPVTRTDGCTALADVIDGLERLAAGTTIGRVTFLP